MWPWPSIADIKKAYNSTISSVSKTYDKAVATTKSAYNKTATRVTKAGLATQKWAVDHKEALLIYSKNLQNYGDKTAAVRAVVAIPGLTIAGTGTDPGATVAAAGKTVSLIGAFWS